MTRSPACFHLEGWEIRIYTDPKEFLAGDPSDRSGLPPILDFRFPTTNGLEVQKVLIERQIRMPIIFLTAHGDIPLAVKAMQRGAVDFLTKPVDTDHLIAAIERALRVDTLHRHGFNAQADLDWTLKRLAGSRKDVLRLPPGKLSNKQIAERLQLSERTVENYRANIYRRLNVHGTDELRQLPQSPADLRNRRCGPCGSSHPMLSGKPGIGWEIPLEPLKRPNDRIKCPGKENRRSQRECADERSCAAQSCCRQALSDKL